MIPFGFFKSSAFIPFSQPISRMAIWLKSTIGVLNGGVPCTDASDVSVWQDQSGNNNHFNTISTPIFYLNQLNGFPSVNFNGDYMVSTNAITPRYAFFVVNIPSNQGSFSAWNVLLGLNNGGESGYIARLDGTSNNLWNNDNNSLMGVGRSNGVSIGGYSTNDLPVNNDVFTQYTSGPNTGYLDSDLTGNIGLGQTNGRPIVANVIEVIIYDRDLTDSEIAHNENYLCSKYGIAPETGMYVWLKAGAGVLNLSSNPASDGDPILTWDDQSGNGNNASVPYASPYFKASAQNNLPSIQLTGSGNQGLLVSVNRTFPETQFYVCYDDPSDSGDRTVVDGNQNARRLLTQHTDKSGYPNWSLYYSGTPVRNTWAPQGTWSIVSVVQNGALSTFRVNGNPVSCNLGNISSNQLSIGNDGGFVTGLVGYISEAILYPKALAANDMASVERYLSIKYNIPIYPPPPDMADLIRWWEPGTGFDGSSNWSDKIHGVTMTGTASLSTASLGNNNMPSIYTGLNGVGMVDSTNYTGTRMSVYYIAKPLSHFNRIMYANVNNWLLGWWNSQQGSFYFDGIGAWLYYQGIDGNPHIYAMNTDGSVANCYGDGKLIRSGTDGASSPNGLCIGASGSVFGDEWTECLVGDILIYNTVHDEATAKAVMQWLNSKYGVY